MASSSLSTVIITNTGPKTSSLAIIISALTPVKRVGSINNPSPELIALPPSINSAPSLLATSM